ATGVLRAFTPEHLRVVPDEVEVGSAVSIVGFPLGFHDTLHHLPVVRQSAIASAFGVRFQGQGYFLTDARTHRGTSGAPVVMHDREAALRRDPLPWKLLGVHSARLDMPGRDLVQDESLGLNSAWYADMLMTLSER
ncbi:MAG: serine protease, partial [Betaproteobacteria bacterium]